MENIAYALTQVIHNFGAVAIVAGALVGLKSNADQLDLKRTMAWIVAIAWGAQGLSGLFFGGISLVLYGETPDLHGTAYVALIIKMLSAVTGFTLAFLYLRNAQSWSEAGRKKVWHALAGIGTLALICAAFLRWFS